MPAKTSNREGPDLANAVTSVGLDGLEPSTSSLSGMRSNRLSYRPFVWRRTARPVNAAAQDYRIRKGARVSHSPGG